MKANIFLLILLLLTISTTNGQVKKGYIIDPDGYSNVRESANGNSKILARVVDGEIFKYSNTASPWYPIETCNNIRGFMHKSRIKEFNGSRDFCFNPNLTEILLFRKNHGIISVCGIPATETIGFGYYSGLIVYDGLNKIKLLEFSEGQSQSFEFLKGDIIIKEYSNIPSTKNFKPSLTPYSISKILFVAERTIIVKNSPFYQYPELSKVEVKSKIAELKNTEIQEKDYYRVIDIALVLALNDSTEGKDFFFNLSEQLNSGFDGEYGEKYSEARIIYEINKNNR